ncbi:MAG: class I SAM-dependent methyltransferase [Gammaproteobacteria bacterium]|nr:class I SAM-dependent methyltransferase [Gammaproteobacteria bacterium]
MSSLASDIDRHYGGTDVSARILSALAGAGKDIDALTRADLAPFDEFHGGGLASTRDLARFAHLAPGAHVLDIGCGIGGPARTLASEFGCSVVGVDLTHEFIRAARMLTTRLKLDGQCSFEHGSATTLLFGDASFDLVWSQNMLMNVSNKAQLFDEVVRVLRPGGHFALETVLAGDGRAIHLPAFWASRLDLSFLVTRRELERLLEHAGLEVVALEDTTAAVIANGLKRRAALAAQDPRALSIDVIVPDDVELKMDNMLKNNQEGRTVTIKALFQRRV